MTSTRFGPSPLWKRVNLSLGPAASIDLDSFKSSSTNFNISLWNPQTNGVRYLKTLLFRLLSESDSDDFALYARIHHREIGRPTTVRVRGQDVCLDYYQALNPLRLNPYGRTDITVGLGQFLDANCKDMSMGYIRSLQYDKIITAYGKHFAPDQLCVLPYEQLESNSSQFIARFANALAVDQQSLTAAYFKKSRRNVTLGARKVRWRSLRKYIPIDNIRTRLWFLHGIQKQFDRWLDGTKPVRPTLNEAQVTQVEEFYRASNRRTEQLTGLRLGELGYPV